jgi:hypothetical protein
MSGIFKRRHGKLFLGLVCLLAAAIRRRLGLAETLLSIDPMRPPPATPEADVFRQETENVGIRFGSGLVAQGMRANFD